MREAEQPRSPQGWLVAAGRGDLLGALGRRAAEHAHLLDAAGDVAEITWSDARLAGTLLHPFGRVVLEEDGSSVRASCSICASERALCGHAGAVALQWLRVRESMLAGGDGTVWRRGAAQPFLPGVASDAARIDLTHIVATHEIAEALSVQLSLGRTRPPRARLAGDRLEIVVEPDSGPARIVSVATRAVPDLLAGLRVAGVALEGDLTRIEPTDIRMLPRLRASVPENGTVLLEPGYVVDGTFVAAEAAAESRMGTWVRLGDRLHRTAAIPTPLLPFFRRGTARLTGEAAAVFLDHDHFALFDERWYEPRGELAAAARFPRPRLAGLRVAGADGSTVRVLPRFVGPDGDELDWSEIRALDRSGFARRAGSIVRPPDLAAFAEAGFADRDDGLVGDRNAYLRLVTDSGMAGTGAPPDLDAVAAILDERSRVEAPPMPGLRSHLRGYQRLGAAWLWRLYRTGLGALLADDMGLGKTHQAMALLCAVRAEKPDAAYLVVCPRGVLEHWRHLLASFAPGLPVHVFHGARRRLRQRLPGTVVLTTYEVALRSAAELARRDWEIVVFDEAQRVKNPRTKGARVVKTIPARFRLALSGTPLENRLLELWSIFEQIIPGYLGSERAFRLEHRQPTPERLDRLRRRVAPFTLRRLKEQVLSDLPEKSEAILYADLSARQQALYRELEAAQASPLIERLLDERQDVPYMHIFALLTRLKQACDHPALVDRRLAHVEPGKMALLDEILDEALAAGNRVVVFSQYVEMISILERHLRRRDVGHLVLTGRTRDRGAVVERFNSARHEPVLLASLLASGVGIDLTAASVVVHYDRWWNPAREDQATDRVHRIGQRKLVQVFKLVTSNTIEERIDLIIRRKAALVDEVVTPTEDLLRRFSRAELAEILGHAEPDAPAGSGQSP